VLEVIYVGCCVIVYSLGVLWLHDIIGVSVYKPVPAAA
jgi:hypothetical protein